MSALAQFARFTGAEVSGSDRFHESPDTADLRGKLLGLGCRIFPQDGSGITAGTGAVCVSTAIEGDNRDLSAARCLGIPVLHRSDLLAEHIRARRTVAVAGTSGKSTVTAMVFEFLTAGRSPSLLSGANLLRLEERGLVGNAFLGESDLLIVEADESDGTLVRYRPWLSVVLNVSKDHKPVPELVGLFRALAANSERTIVNADDPLLADLPAVARFGFGGAADVRPESVELLPGAVTLTRAGVACRLPIPGRHNAANLLAALAVCAELGIGPAEIAGAAAAFHGVARRFGVTRTREGVIVVDDFAHNPEKIRAAVSAARTLSARVIALYQPHGFGPTRFLRAEYREAFREALGEGDGLCLLPIFYAGGTAVKDISSRDLVEDLGPVPFPASAPADRDEALAWLLPRVRRGDLVLLMGARDPSLAAFARRIVEALGGPA
jgi:UDP-N-acetylmuramate--alanine ligase